MLNFRIPTTRPASADSPAGEKTGRFHIEFVDSMRGLAGLGLPLVVVLAYVFHLLFEKPFLNSPVAPQLAASATP